MPSPSLITQSLLFKRLQARAEQWINHPNKIQHLARAALSKGIKKRLAPFKDFGSSLSVSLRLLKAYASGAYQALPKRSLIALVAALAYFLMPADVVPDFITGIGLFDDMALLGWVLKSLRTDLKKFEQWEKNS